MSKQTRKTAKKLARRQKAHVCTSLETKVINRWASGGFPAPGSMNRHKG